MVLVEKAIAPGLVEPDRPGERRVMPSRMSSPGQPAGALAEVLHPAAEAISANASTSRKPLLRDVVAP
jgi:hypothetical protein